MCEEPSGSGEPRASTSKVADASELALMEASLVASGSVGGRLRAFVGKHWNGDYALPRAFWLNRMIASGVLLAFTSPFKMLTSVLTVQQTALAFTATSLAAIVVEFWHVRGTWRSARRHIAAKKRFGRLAQGFLIVGVVANLFQLAVALGSSDELWPILRGDQPGPALTVSVSDDGTAVFLTGGLNDGTARALSQALERAPSVRTVVLDSVGGWLHEGTATARIVAERGLDTHVEAACISACTFVFLAGRERSLGAGARLGFHRLRTPMRAAHPGADATQTRMAYRAAGIPHDFVEQVVATLPEDVWYPPLSELIRNKVVTVTHEWDEASSDLEPGVRRAVHAALGEQGLPTVTVERLVQCEIARQIHWLNATGCTYFDIAVPETEAEVACYREAEQVAARAGDDCWQKFGPSAEKGR